MDWFKPDSRRHPQRIDVPQILFVGEQDGPPERELKTRLIAFFQRDASVRSAYLAQVAYRESSAISVALCLGTQFGRDPGLAEKVGRIFASMFGGREHLDIVFLSDVQEAELAKKCPRFFGQ
jgi:hypothetical protein